MAEYYKVSPDLGAKLASRFLQIPDDYTNTKSGKRFTETFVVDDVEFTKEDDHELLRVGLRVPLANGSVNGGRQISEFFRFYWQAAESGKPENRAMQTQINYQNFNQLTQALGVDGFPSPGELRKDEVQGLQVQANVTIGPDKDGETRQRLSGWKAAS